MENLAITVECIRDLVTFHAERISGYEAMLDGLTQEEQHLATLFNAFIKQSGNMKEELLQISTLWGLDVEQLQHHGKYGSAWSMVKAVFSSRMPSYSLDKCRSGENALLIAYHSVEGTEGLQPAVRSLINRQKREVIAARDWIDHFGRLQDYPEQEQLAAIS